VSIKAVKMVKMAIFWPVVVVLHAPEFFQEAADFAHHFRRWFQVVGNADAMDMRLSVLENKMEAIEYQAPRRQGRAVRS
jgi:hypothetical protein